MNTTKSEVLAYLGEHNGKKSVGNQEERISGSKVLAPNRHNSYKFFTILSCPKLASFSLLYFLFYLFLYTFLYFYKRIVNKLI